MGRFILSILIVAFLMTIFILPFTGKIRKALIKGGRKLDRILSEDIESQEDQH